MDLLAFFCDEMKKLHPEMRVAQSEPRALSLEPIFYVYAYYVLGEEEPFYIGKGSGDRAYKHLMACNLKRGTMFYCRLINLLGQEIKPIVKILHENLTEVEAFNIETELIAQYGRLDIGTGCLTNHTDGGDGASGHIYSEESRRKMSIGAQTRIARDGTYLNNVSIETRIKRSYNASKHRNSKETREKMSQVAVKLRGQPVESFDLKTGEIIKQYPSLAHAERDGHSRSAVRACAHGKMRHFHGLGWRLL